MTNGTETPQPRVLVVDDEQSNLDTISRVFRKQFVVKTARSGLEALDLIKAETFDVALVDHAMPGMTGVEFLREAKALCPHLGLIMLTAHGDLDEVKNAHATGLAVAVILKPWSKSQIEEWVLRLHKVSLMRQAVDGMKSNQSRS